MTLGPAAPNHWLNVHYTGDMITMKPIPSGQPTSNELIVRGNNLAFGLFIGTTIGGLGLVFRKFVPESVQFVSVFCGALYVWYKML